MSSEIFEYDLTFLPFGRKFYGKPNRKGLNGFLNSINTGDKSLSPYIDKFFADSEYKKELAKKGSEGWELVSVQQLLEGVGEYVAPNGGGYGFSITNGFLLFWKRKKPSKDD